MYAYMDKAIQKIIQTGNRELINKLIHGEDEVVCLPEEMPKQARANDDSITKESKRRLAKRRQSKEDK